MHQGIEDITPLTLLDYPGKAACILGFGGCNMRCRYCYNADLAKGCKAKATFPSHLREKSLEEFLKTRAGFLDGVVLSGGECSLCPDLPEICRLAQSLGYEVKMDTNGTRPDTVRFLVEQGLVNYIALDYKAPSDEFANITGGCSANLFAAFGKTLQYLIGSEFPFEVRTTVHPDLLDEKAVGRIIKDLAARGYRGTYYLQHYFHTDHNMDQLERPVRAFDPGKLPGNIPVVLRHFKTEPDK